MKDLKVHNERMANLVFASIYPMYLEKIKKKNRTKSELDEVIKWLTGFDQKKLQKLIKEEVTFETFLKTLH